MPWPDVLLFLAGFWALWGAGYLAVWGVFRLLGKRFDRMADD